MKKNRTANRKLLSVSTVTEFKFTELKHVANQFECAEN